MKKKKVQQLKATSLLSNHWFRAVQFITKALREIRWISYLISTLKLFYFKRFFKKHSSQNLLIEVLKKRQFISFLMPNPHERSGALAILSK